MQLMTFHRAKGLEFDAVFLPRLLDGELPFRSRRSEADPEEERRLLYVGHHARTRAPVPLVALGRARRAEPVPRRDRRERTAGADARAPADGGRRRHPDGRRGPLFDRLKRLAAHSGRRPTASPPTSCSTTRRSCRSRNAQPARLGRPGRDRRRRTHEARTLRRRGPRRSSRPRGSADLSFGPAPPRSSRRPATARQREQPERPLGGRAEPGAIERPGRCRRRRRRGPRSRRRGDAAGAPAWTARAARRTAPRSPRPPRPPRSAGSPSARRTRRSAPGRRPTPSANHRSEWKAPPNTPGCTRRQEGADGDEGEQPGGHEDHAVDAEHDRAHQSHGRDPHQHAATGWPCRAAGRGARRARARRARRQRRTPARVHPRYRS